MLKAGAYAPVSVADEVEAWVAAVREEGGDVSDSRVVIVGQFLLRLKAAGILLLIDQLNPWWGEDEAQACVCLVSRRVAVPVNSPTFEANRGYTGNGSTSYLDTTFVPSTMAVAISGGFHHLGAQILTNVSGTISVMGAGGAAATRIRPRTAANAVGTQIESAFGSFVDSVTDSTGYVAVQRAGTATIQGRKDDAALTDLTVGTLNTALPTFSTFVLARNNGGVPAEYFTGQVGLTYECAPLSSAQWTTMRSAIRAFGQAVGAVA
jgi:hypothetical protein